MKSICIEALDMSPVFSPIETTYNKTVSTNDGKHSKLFPSSEVDPIPNDDQIIAHNEFGIDQTKNEKTHSLRHFSNEPKENKLRILQEGGVIDFSFILNKPLDEWNGEEWGIAGLLIFIFFVIGGCFCCCCCLAKCCGRGFSRRNGYYDDNGYYNRQGGRGSCLQDLVCLWCCWEIFCTDDICDPALGYQEAVW